MRPLLFIDHYDSFSSNLVDWLETKSTFKVKRVFSDDINGLFHARSLNIPVVLSPGPKAPTDAVNTINFVKDVLGKRPVLGVCLGHQILGHVLGWKVIRCEEPSHGDQLKILRLDGSVLLEGVSDVFEAATYNSLVLSPDNIPLGCKVTAVSRYDEVQAFEKIMAGGASIFGVQFHPESFLSEGVSSILEGFCRAVDSWQSSSG